MHFQFQLLKQTNCSIRERPLTYKLNISTSLYLVRKDGLYRKTVKHLFSNKIQGSNCITLLENDVVESDDTRDAEILNCYFVDITKTLGIACEVNHTNLDMSLQDNL